MPGEGRGRAERARMAAGAVGLENGDVSVFPATEWGKIETSPFSGPGRQSEARIRGGLARWAKPPTRRSGTPRAEKPLWNESNTPRAHSLTLKGLSAITLRYFSPVRR